MNKILVMILLACGANGVASAEPPWELRYDLPEGILEIHASSIYPATKKEYKGWRKVRIRMTYPKVQTDSRGQHFVSREAVEMVSCSERLRKPLSEVKYTGKFGTGKRVAEVFWSNAGSVPIAPGSSEELVLGEANCNYVTGKWATIDA